MSCGYHQCLAVYVAVFLGMSTLFPPAVDGFQWIKPTTSSGEPAPLFLRSVVYYPNNVSVTMTWEWRLDGSEAFSGVIIRRHKEGDKANTETQVAHALVVVGGGLSKTTDNNYYNQTVNTGKNGGITFTIKDVTNQTNNQGGGAVNVLVADYVYRCELNVANVNPTQRTSEIKLIVNEKAKITAPPQSQYITQSNKQVKLKCTATGKPQPEITWEITKNGLQQNRSGEEIIIDPFRKADVGVYKCMAKNDYGDDTAEAVLQYTACGSGCTTDSNFTIEMTKLNYNDGYDNQSSVNYKNLKDKIERACLLLYTKQADPKMYSCIVTGFRYQHCQCVLFISSFTHGSVVAKMTLTYPAGTINPRKPLQDAINTCGKFAGYDVTRSYLNFTSVDPYVTSSSSQVPSSGPSVTPSSSQAPRTGPSVKPSSSQAPSSDPVPIIVLGLLLGLSVVLNVILILYIVWKYRQGQKVRSSDRKHFAGGSSGKTNVVALQDTNQSPSNPSLYQSVEPHSRTVFYV